MELTGDVLAGVADLFGGLNRSELSRALAELAYRQGETYDPGRYDEVIDEACRSYHLVVVDTGAGSVEDNADQSVSADEGDGALLLAGPLAFPELPPDAGDLPHILDIEAREVDTEEAREQTVDRFRTDAREAVEAGEDAHIEMLLDASYELESWAGVDLTAVREELVTATPTS